MSETMIDDALHEARRNAGLSVSEACEILGRSRRTWQHWRQHGAPAWALRVLAIYGGELEPLGWPGWRLYNGKLWAPGGAYSWTQGQLFAEHWNQQRLALLLREKREQKEKTLAARQIRGDAPPGSPVSLSEYGAGTTALDSL